MRLLAFVFVFLVPRLSFAQQGPSILPPALLSSEVKRRVAESVARAVEENYVFPDTGRMVAEYIRGRVRAGAYETPMDAGRLGDRLSADMKAVNGDLHLYAQYVAGGSANVNAPDARVVRRRPGEAMPADQLQMTRRMNHNIDAAQRLAGNVGYLAVSELSGRSDEAYRVLDAALSFLERTDAMIIDLRGTRGGSPRMTDYLAGYFLGDSVRTLNSYTRSIDETWERRTPRVNGAVRRDVPLFLLVGPGTASGAEDLAFALKAASRATLVGARTAGAGRLTAIYPVGDGFAASVSGGRTYDPKTGQEWERVGIEPDVSTAVDEALTAAHAAALERVASSITDERYKQALNWTRRVVLARATPIVVPERTLRQYVGAYGLRLVRFERGKLWYLSDARRAAEELTPVDEHTFALGEATRVGFLRENGRVTAMRVSPPLLPPAVFPRSP